MALRKTGPSVSTNPPVRVPSPGSAGTAAAPRLSPAQRRSNDVRAMINKADTALASINQKGWSLSAEDRKMKKDLVSQLATLRDDPSLATRPDGTWDVAELTKRVVDNQSLGDGAHDIGVKVAGTVGAVGGMALAAVPAGIGAVLAGAGKVVAGLTPDSSAVHATANRFKEIAQDANLQVETLALTPYLAAAKSADRSTSRANDAREFLGKLSNEELKTARAGLSPGQQQVIDRILIDRAVPSR